MMSGEVTRGTTEKKGQGGILPAKGDFGCHYIVKYGNSYYDPSYGGLNVATQELWENASIAGFAVLFFADKNDPNLIETDFDEMP